MLQLDPSRRELIEALEKMIALHDRKVRNEDANSPNLQQQLDIVNFARRVLTRAKKNAQQAQASEPLERRTSMHDASSDSSVGLVGERQAP